MNSAQQRNYYYAMELCYTKKKMNNWNSSILDHIRHVSLLVLHENFWYVINTTAYRLGQSSGSYPRQYYLHLTELPNSYFQL